MKKDIYNVFLESGVEISNHYSDMYVPATDFTRNTLKDYSDIHHYTTFINQINGKPYYDIPFAYKPYWESLNKQPRNVKQAVQNSR